MDRELELRRGETVVVLSEDRPRCEIGRSPQCQFVIDSDEVSRLHARVEHRHGHFVLVDLSTNGTTVTRDGGDRYGCATIKRA